MARREGDAQWQPLYDCEVYRREVPVTGDPREAANIRSVRTIVTHLVAFVGVGLGLTLMTGSPPFWLAFWGIGLAAHTIRIAPAAWSLARERGLLGGRKEAGAALPGPGAPALPAAAPSPLAQEAERVRALLEKRGGDDKDKLLADVDGIVRLASDLAGREAPARRHRPGLVAGT